METRQYKNLLALILFFLLIVLDANAYEEIKKIKYAFQIDQAASIELDNQYGDIEVVDWEKDSIKIEASITVKSENINEINEMFGLVEVNCHGNRTNVVVSTEWTEASNIWKRSAHDLKKLYGSEKNLVISFKVYMPKSCRLSVTNRFGDVYLPEINGPLRVSVSHGDLRARSVKDARKIEVKYGKVLIKNIEEGWIDLSYGTLIVDKANRVTIESKSSSIEFYEIEKLTIESRNDDIRLESINTLRGNIIYSELRAKKIIRLVDLNTSFGDVTLRQIMDGFYSIRLNGNNTDYVMEFEENSAFQFSVESTGSKNVSFMNEAVFDSEEQDGNTKFFKGYLKQKDASPIINVVSKSGYISLF
jgi:hypothetical protein